MKIFLTFFFLNFLLYNISFANNIKNERIKQIHERIINNLLEQEKKSYLQNPHVIKITVKIKNKENISGEIRLPVGTIKCVKKINAQNQEIFAIKFNDIKTIDFLKWKYIKVFTKNNYDKYLFSPSIIKIITKDDKNYYMIDKLKLITKLFIFQNNNDIKRVFADFVLYYDRVKKTFYNVGKNFNYFTSNPVSNTLTGFTIENYMFISNPNSQNNIVSENNNQQIIKMRESESAAYFERMRKEREKIKNKQNRVNR